MSMIQVENLTFAYDGSFDTIFEDVSFRIDTDWKIGLIGRNGRGKTTFLHLLMGKYVYKGRISASVSFHYFPYPVEDESLNTLHVLEGITDAPLWQIRRELSYMDVDEEVLYRPFASLSGGERTKTLLAALFLKDNHFLLIDEPTNHLDLETRRAVGAYLKRKKGFLLVSHDRYFLDQCVDHILSINKTNMELQKGDFSSWWENKERRDRFEYAENQMRKRQIQDLTEAAKRTASWSDKVEKSKHQIQNSGLRPDRGYIGHKAAKLMKRSKTVEARMEKAVEEKSRLLKNIEASEDLKLHPQRYYKDRLAHVRNLSICRGGRCVCSDVDFTVRQGDRIALQGRNGSGKSSIIKLFLGMDIPFTGDIHIESGVCISYVPQDASCVQGNMNLFIKDNNLDDALFKAILRKLDFGRHHFDQDLRSLSAGQKKKILLAKSLCERAHLYIWDEPLNFIDVLSRMQIEKLLLEYAPTLLFVEHDQTFVEKISTKTVVL